MEKSSEESNQKKTLVERHHKYSIEQKIKIVNEIEETSTNAFNKKYGIDKNAWEIGNLIRINYLDV